MERAGKAISSAELWGGGIFPSDVPRSTRHLCPCADSHKKANAMPPAGSPVAGQGLKWAGEPTTDVLTGICWGQALVGEKGCGLRLCPSFAHRFLPGHPTSVSCLFKYPARHPQTTLPSKLCHLVIPVLKNPESLLRPLRQNPSCLSQNSRPS